MTWLSGAYTFLTNSVLAESSVKGWVQPLLFLLDVLLSSQQNRVVSLPIRSLKSHKVQFKFNQYSVSVKALMPGPVHDSGQADRLEGPLDLTIQAFNNLPCSSGLQNHGGFRHQAIYTLIRKSVNQFKERDRIKAGKLVICDGIDPKSMDLTSDQVLLPRASSPADTSTLNQKLVHGSPTSLTVSEIGLDRSSYPCTDYDVADFSYGSC
ncbi:hypothetical protein VNO77_14775 [Canavalia gladiata]|uniref:Uncharacterized protein n=1 Tax=Canavalia gladiata TaxID=3824 RepID=A0AAN9LYG2_CANGL